MEKIKSISERDKKILLILLSVGLIVLAYQFGYVRFNDKTDEINEKSKQLTVLLNELEEKEANKEQYLSEMETMNKDITEIVNKFPTTLAQENLTMFVVDLEKAANIKVSSISFNEVSVFYNNSAEEVVENQTEDAQTGNEQAKMDNNEDTQTDIAIKGYESGVVLTYKTTYKGLKEAVDYITSKKGIHISDISMSYDHTTGNLTGSITIPMYALDPEGLEGFLEENAEINIDNINIGSKNIFGTFEMPLE